MLLFKCKVDKNKTLLLDACILPYMYMKMCHLFILAGAWARDILYVAEKSSIVQQLQEKIYKTVMKMYFADVFCSLAWSWKKKGQNNAM